MKFKLITGTHSVLRTQKTYVKGDIVESAADLTKLFVNKFVKVAEDFTEEVPKTPSPVVKPLPVVKEDEHVDIVITDVDVTDQFPIAIEEKIKVIKTKGWYNLYDEAEENFLINKKALRLASVENAIKDYLEDQ